MKRSMPLLSVVACVIGLCCATRFIPALASSAQEAPATQAASPRPSGTSDMGTRLVEAMQSVEGCNDASLAQMADGRGVIFGWFENKAAVMNWYNHPMHAAMRRASGIPAEADREPMADVPEDVPVLAVACIRFDGPPAVEGSMIPFSAISIELYTPVNGGLRINGGFAPEGWADEKPR